MNASNSAHECAGHLRDLARFLGKLGTFGTALIDPDDALEDVWRGLLVWDIAKGARTGIVVRCEQTAPDQRWQFTRDDTGEELGGVYERLRVSQLLGETFRPWEAMAQVADRVVGDRNP